jgi:NAD(P)-dependent dehydrogenase (short-subunit alcohol dehydrogenase family)
VTRRRGAHGGLDVLVANAGVAPPVAAPTDYDLSDWRRVPAINLDAAIGTDLGALLERTQGRLGEVEDITPLAVWLASDRCRLATGASFVLDGGLTASML